MALGNGETRIVDLVSGAGAHSLRPGHVGGVYCVAWSPAHEYVLATGGADGKVCVAQPAALALSVSRSAGLALTRADAIGISMGHSTRAAVRNA